MEKDEKFIEYSIRERKLLLKEIKSQFKLKKGDIKKVTPLDYKFRYKKWKYHLKLTDPRGKLSIDGILYKYIDNRLLEMLIIEVKVRDQDHDEWRLIRNKMESVMEFTKYTKELSFGYENPPKPKVAIVVIGHTGTWWFQMEPEILKNDSLWFKDDFNESTALSLNKKKQQEYMIARKSDAVKTGSTKNDIQVCSLELY